MPASPATEVAQVPPAAPGTHAAADPAAADAGPPRRSLSPSRASDFQQCPLLYRFRTVDKLPEPPSPAAVRGTLVHSALEHLFDLPAEARTPQAAEGLLPGRWEQLQVDEPDVASLFEESAAERAWLESAAALVRTWFTLEDPTRLEPAERELRVETQLESGLLLRGIIDRVDVAPNGLVRVVDYKTGRSPGEGFEGKALFQMRFYALAVWRLRGVVPALLQLVYLGDGVVLRLQPTEDELLATERKLEALSAAIERARESGDWRPRTSKLCGWCAHQALCPAFGGTPPPLPVVIADRSGAAVDTANAPIG
ncbi:RecB family exonuclease [Quadrisphaera sp. KR29]|uniref:RecB family exonuclease n=1 Tax=Quadrisphaera sp. KR29 TaxID=3461391 RepID=UPI004044B856